MTGGENKMIAYCKYVLEKFVFNSRLFRKEYRKCFRLLDPHVHREFSNWARTRFRFGKDRQQLMALMHPGNNNNR